MTRIHLRFIATLKLSFKFSAPFSSCAARWMTRMGQSAGGAGAKKNGEAFVPDMNVAMIAAAETANPADCFARGMIYSSGAGVPVDLIEAHKWFNIAAMRGHADAARLRREIAEQMSDAEIGRAQRAARDWLKAHPQAPAPVVIRAAA